MIEASDLSPEAKRVWESLDEGLQKTIQKDNPFRVERDNAIFGLSKRGVKVDILAEITGVSRNAVHRIIMRLAYPVSDRPYSRKRRPAKSRINLEALYRELLFGLNKAFGRGGDETNAK
ncbi:MAG: hypothetical protein RDU59_07200 [Thermodesulfobacteriota bacterium]|nr:hypothetical protein [Thermodesulfobacteriota bacterium]